MSVALQTRPAEFFLMVRCLHCLHEGSWRISVPVEEGAVDLDAFLASTSVPRLGYRCVSCEGVSGKVTGIRRAS